MVVGHIELLKSYHGFPSLADNLAVYELGRIAVTFFFVLSGFLITFLLLKERHEIGTISVGRFYLRRILRIWPLYYLVVFLAFVVVPRVDGLAIPSLTAAGGDHQAAVASLFLVLLPQVALSLYPPVPYAEPLWSIGVEEQFYLLWPLLLARIKRIVPLAIGIVVVGVALKQGALIYASTLKDRTQLPFWNHLIDYFYFNRFECMAIGAIGAWLLFERRERVLRVLFSKPMQLAVYVAATAAVLTTRGKPILQHAPHAVLFGIIILNVAANEQSILKLRSPAWILLGDASYAMYMLHELAVVTAMRLITSATGSQFRDLPSHVALYVFGIGLTVAFAVLAFKVFERPFLRMKDRFTLVKSGALKPRV